jgi:uncharacterized protein
MSSVSEAQERIRSMLFKGMDSLSAGDTNSWLEMFADDGAMEFPYAPEGRPRRVEGKPALAAYMAEIPKLFRIDRVVSFVAHPVADPDLAIIEFSVEGELLESRQPYNQSYVGIIRLRNGKIVNYRDYWNPLAAMTVRPTK